MMKRKMKSYGKWISAENKVTLKKGDLKLWNTHIWQKRADAIKSSFLIKFKLQLYIKGKSNS